MTELRSKSCWHRAPRPPRPDPALQAGRVPAAALPAGRVLPALLAASRVLPALLAAGRVLPAALSAAVAFAAHALLLAAVAFTAHALLARPCFAAGYPTKPVHLIVPFTPGGSTDILARAVADSLSAAWSQPVVIDNKPGAGGTIGAVAAAKSAPDGYTLFMGHIGTLAVNPSLYSQLPYDPVKDFAPITLVATVPNVLVVRPALPVHSVADLVALARARPGTLHYSSGGNGSAAHLATEYFKLVTRTDIVHVPYKGTAPAVTDLIGGQVDLTMTGLPPVLPHVKSGRLRAIAVASAGRLSLVPELPTIAESGFPGFEATQWYGVLAPAGTPAAVIDKIHADLAAALGTPEVKRRLESEGAEPVGAGPPRFAAFIAAEIERWGKVIREARIKVE